MKKLVLILLLLFPSLVLADRLVSDPSPELARMGYEIWQASVNLSDSQVVATGKMVASKAYEVDGSINYNLDALAPGSFNWYIRSFGQAYTYGPNNTLGGSTVYSVFIPFNFTKSTVVVSSIPGLRLAP